MAPKWGISIYRDQNPNCSGGGKKHRQAKCETIPPLCSQENARKSQIRPFSQSQNTTKMRKINRWWPKSNQFSRWSGYISMSNFRPFKVTAIKRINLTLMPPQRLKWKGTIAKKKKKNAKNTKLQFGSNPEYMFNKSSRGLIMGNFKLLQ